MSDYHHATKIANGAVHHEQFKFVREEIVPASEIHESPSIWTRVTGYIYTLDEGTTVRQCLRSKLPVDQPAKAPAVPPSDPLGAHPLQILFIGTEASGKSVLIEKLRNPTATEGELLKIERTRVRMEVDGQSFNIGTSTVFTKLVDHPGAGYGVQASSLLKADRARLLLWVIVLSVSPAPSAAGGTDSAYLKQQLGQLSLPIGLLGSRLVSRPDAIVVCLTKFDQVSPDPPHEAPARVEKFKDHFRQHLSLVKGVARESSIPVVEVVTSATRGWGINSLALTLETSLCRRTS